VNLSDPSAVAAHALVLNGGGAVTEGGPISVRPPVAQPAPAPVPTQPPPPAPERRSFRFDFSKYADIDLLGDGEAKQKLRKLEDDLQVAQKELGQAQTTLEGTRRL